MSESLALLRRVFSYGTVTMVSVGAMFLFHIVTGRLLGVEDYGRFSFALTFSLMLAPMLDPGLYYLVIRETARDSLVAGKYLLHVLVWKVACSPIFLGVVLLGVGLIHESDVTTRVVAVLAVAQVLHSTKDAFRSILLGREKFRLDAFSLTVERFGLLAVCGLVLWKGGSLFDLCVAYTIVRVVDMAIAAALVSRNVSIRLPIEIGFLSRILRSALPIGAFYITLNIYSYIDITMLSALRDHDEVGWYSAAYRLYEGPIMIPAIIGTVFMPRLSRLYVEHKERFFTILRRGVEWVIGAATVVTVVGFGLSHWLIHLSFGAGYDRSVSALKILLLGAVFAFTINFLQTVLISIDRQRVVLYVALGGLVGNVALNSVLIPRYGYIGASAATVVVEAFVCVVLVVYVWRRVRSEISELSTGSQ